MDFVKHSQPFRLEHRVCMVSANFIGGYAHSVLRKNPNCFLIFANRIVSMADDYVCFGDYRRGMQRLFMPPTYMCMTRLYNLGRFDRPRFRVAYNISTENVP
jgi:hypothetical protein